MNTKFGYRTWTEESSTDSLHVLQVPNSQVFGELISRARVWCF